MSARTADSAVAMAARPTRPAARISFASASTSSSDVTTVYSRDDVSAVGA
jgi:hypothetical protein